MAGWPDRAKGSPRTLATSPRSASAGFLFVGQIEGNMPGRWHAQRAAMAYMALDSILTQWAPLAHSGPSRAALVALAEREPSIAALALDDLGDLLEAVAGRHRRLDRVAADRMLGLLVTHQDVDPLVGVGVVVALVPGLVHVGERMSWGATGPWGDPECYVGELVTTTWEVVSDWAGRRREFMALALLSSVRKRLVRRAECWQRELAGRTDVADLDGVEGQGLSVAEHLARVLEDAVKTVGRRDMAIVYARRVLGMTASDLAVLTGESRHALNRRLALTEQRLCA